MPWISRCAILVFSWLVAGPLLAVGPDDAFVAIYNIIQSAEPQRELVQLSAAHSNYGVAQERLQEFQKSFPTWNERIIQYRLRYVTERLDELKDHAVVAVTNAAPQATPAAATPAIAPEGEVLAQFRAF